MHREHVQGVAMRVIDAGFGSGLFACDNGIQPVFVKNPDLTYSRNLSAFSSFPDHRVLRL